MSWTMALAVNGLLAFPGGGDAGLEPVPFVVQAGLPDAASVLSPSQIHIGGWLGARIDANEKNRLLTVDTEPLLAGYRKRPGSHPWIGEHAGKWLHAATFVLAYDQARNPGLPSAAAVGLVRESKELTIQPGPSLAFRGPVVGRKGDSPSQAVFVPFADAGSTGGDYRVWLRAAETTRTRSSRCVVSSRRSLNETRPSFRIWGPARGRRT